MVQINFQSRITDTLHDFAEIAVEPFLIDIFVIERRRGLSEQVVINYLIKDGKIETPSKGIFVLESVGKYNIPRFMNLLGELQIKHAVLHDLDGTAIKKKDVNEGLNSLIHQSKNACTRAIESLPENLESSLGIGLTGIERWKKASQILVAVQQDKIASEKLAAFKSKIEVLLSSLTEQRQRK
jgi:putative ATP-dependent endonuclease of the OLD family